METCGRKKICIFSGYMPPHLGGVESYTEKIAAALAADGHDVTVVTSNDRQHPDKERTQDYAIYRIPVYPFFKTRYPIPRKNRKYRQLLSEVDAGEFDYYICQTRFHLTTMIGAGMARRHRKVPVVIEHGSGHFSVNNKLLDMLGERYEHFLTYLLKKKKPVFYGVSERCNKWLSHFGIKPGGVFYNSVCADDYEAYKNRHYLTDKGQKTVITFAGRLLKEKGITELIEAYLRIAPDRKDTILCVAGDGPLLERLKKDYGGGAEGVVFLGKCSHDDVMALYNDSDIFAYPSMYPEGLPTAILEAGLMKCAVLATDRGGVTEVICAGDAVNSEDINDKVTVNPEDINDKEAAGIKIFPRGVIVNENIASIENGLRYLLDNGAVREKMGENIRRLITERFTWEVTARRMIKSLDGTVKSNGDTC